MDEHQAPVAAPESLDSGQEAKADWLSRHGVDTTALGVVLGGFALIVAVVMATGMGAEAYRAPAGKPLAIGLLVLGLAWVLWLLVRPPIAGRRRRGLYIAATAISVVVFLWVPALTADVYDGPTPSTRILAGNISAWASIALLLASIGLATASRRRRRELLPWGIATVLALALMLCVVLIVGVEPFPS